MCARLVWLLSVTLVLASGVAGAQAPPAEPIDLPVPGHTAAVVVPPPDTQPRPVLVATHGSFDRPEWHCDTWPAIFGRRFFVLCPRGALRWDTPQEPSLRRYYYRGGPRLEQEIDAALRALSTRFGDRVAPGPHVYLGFSQGAIYGAPILSRHAARFPRAVLVEGGSGHWTPATARSYARGGGQRVLFACGQSGCQRRAAAAAAVLEQAGVRARVVAAPGTGHTYDGPVAEQIRAAASWLLE